MGAPASAAALTVAAAAAGLRVLASAGWPESAEDAVPPPVAGFVVSSFSPLAAETARRCLLRRPAPALPAAATGTPDTDTSDAGTPVPRTGRPVTAVVVVSPLGDLANAVHVAENVDGHGRLGPLLFFQAVPNAVAGHLAAQWQLTGPVVCVGDTAAAAAVTALLLADGDADEALLIRVDQAHTPGGPDRAAAVLLGPGPQPGREPRPGREPQSSREPQHHEGEQP